MNRCAFTFSTTIAAAAEMRLSQSSEPLLNVTEPAFRADTEPPQSAGSAALGKLST